MRENIYTFLTIFRACADNRFTQAFEILRNDWFHIQSTTKQIAS